MSGNMGQPRPGIHLGAQQAMNAGVGGLHHPIAKQSVGAPGVVPQIMPPMAHPFFPARVPTPVIPMGPPAMHQLLPPAAVASRAPGAHILAAMMAARGAH